MDFVIKLYRVMKVRGVWRVNKFKPGVLFSMTVVVFVILIVLVWLVDGVFGEECNPSEKRSDENWEGWDYKCDGGEYDGRGINCVKCDAHLRCDCPLNHYLRFVTASCPSSDGNEDFCGQFAECGYVCTKCPAGRYNYYDRKCEVNYGYSDRIEVDDEAINQCCRTPDDPRNADFRGLIESHEADEKLKADNEAKLGAYEKVRQAVLDGYTAIEAVDLSEMEDWREHVDENMLDSRYVFDFMEKSATKGAIRGCGGRYDEYCDAGASGVETSAYRKQACWFHADSGVMTVAYMPHEASKFANFRLSYSVLDGQDADDTRLDDGNARCDPNFDNGDTYTTLCTAVQSRRYRVRCLCANCRTIERLKQYIERNSGEISLPPSEFGYLTYFTECVPFDNSQSSAEANRVRGLEAAVTVTYITGAVVTGAIVDSATREERERFRKRQSVLEARCNAFKQGNPNLERKRVRCGTEPHFDDEDGIGEKYGCLAAQSSVNLLENKVLPTRVYSSCEADYDGFHKNQDGILNFYSVNRGSLSFNLCAIEDQCLSIDSLFDKMKQGSQFAGGIEVDFLHDYLNQHYADDASIRKAMNVYLPNLPDGSVMRFYKDSDCLEYYGQTGLHSDEGNPNLVTLRHDSESEDSEGRTLTERVMREWHLIKNTHDRYKVKDGDGNYVNYAADDVTSVPNFYALYDIFATLTAEEFKSQSQYRAFKIDFGSGYGCECTGVLAGLESVPEVEMSEVDAAIFEKTGIHPCRECALDSLGRKRSILRRADEFMACRKQRFKCEECVRNEFPNSDFTECVSCPGFQVVEYDFEAKQWSCRDCNYHEYYYRAEGDYFGECREIPIMSISLNDAGLVVIDNWNTGDQYVPNRNLYPNMIEPVPFGYYLNVSDYAVISCEESLIPNTFYVGCGVQTYKLVLYHARRDEVLEVNPDTLYDLDGKRLDIDDFNDLSVVRGGVLRLCEQCANQQYLSTLCTSENGGFRGRCSDCLSCADIPGGCASVWLKHELNRGCLVADSGSVHVQQPETDYNVTECRYAKLLGNDVFLVLGCGTGAVDIWRYGEAVENGVTCVGQDGRIKSGEMCFDYVNEWEYEGQDSEDDDGDSTTIPVVKSATTQSVAAGGSYLIPMRDVEHAHVWRNQRVFLPGHDPYVDGVGQIPYCPRGHYVQLPLDADDPEGWMKEPWHAEYCVLCRVTCEADEFADSASTIQLWRSANWVECDGKTQEDTQDRCQEGCDLNFYFDEEMQQCRQCELCDVNSFPSGENSNPRGITSSVKEQCAAGRYYKDSTDTCELCEDGTTSEVGANYCHDVCESGTTWDDRLEICI